MLRRRCLVDPFFPLSLLTMGLLVSSGVGCRSSRVVKLKTLDSPLATAPAVSENAQGAVQQATHLDPLQSPDIPTTDPGGVPPTAEPGAVPTATEPGPTIPSEPVVSQLPLAAPAEANGMKSESSSIADSIRQGLQSSQADAVSSMPADSGAAGGNQSLPAPAEMNGEEIPSPLPQPYEISLTDVVASATERFPAIREAALLRSLAIGDQISAMGEFDDRLEAYTINQPLAYYENYRHGVNLKHPLYMGGTAYAGYRLGRGVYEPWYKERETNEGGEFKVGLNMPLLRDRDIDYRRTALRIATLDLQRANPQLFQQVLQTQLDATTAYWNWYSASKQHQIAQQLMSIAETRVDQIEKQIAAGDVARIVGIDNSRLLTMRRAKLIEAKQKLDITAIKLSLYHRDEFTRPIKPSPDTKPVDVPVIPDRPIRVSDEIVRAQQRRPELQLLNLQAQQVRAELNLAINQRLPDVSFNTELSQDVGGQASSSGDKQPLILEAGLTGYVPIQRRKAIGKAQSLRAKLAQIDAKRQLTSEKIANDVSEAATMYDAAHLRLEQAKLNKELAQQTLTAGGISFASGDIDILMLNIYEQAFADAGLEIIHAEVDVLIAEAMLMVATGRSLMEDEVLPPLITETPF